MGKIFSKVDRGKSRSAVEEYDYLLAKREELGNFIPWEEHPNRLKTFKTQDARIYKKILSVVDSEEFKHYTGSK